MPREVLPPYMIVGAGCLALVALSSKLEVGQPPLAMQLVLAGVIILLAISNELHRKAVKNVHA